MKQMTLSVLGAALAFGLATQVDAAPNGYRTEAIDSTDFEVIPRAERFADGYWCAASDFARRKLGADWGQQIYVLRGYGPSVTTGRKTAVQFTLRPPSDEAAAQKRFFNVGFRPGFSMSVSAANARCSTLPFSN